MGGSFRSFKFRKMSLSITQPFVTKSRLVSCIKMAYEWMHHYPQNILNSSIDSFSIKQDRGCASEIDVGTWGKLMKGKKAWTTLFFNIFWRMMNWMRGLKVIYLSQLEVSASITFLFHMRLSSHSVVKHSFHPSSLHVERKEKHASKWYHSLIMRARQLIPFPATVLAVALGCHHKWSDSVRLSRLIRGDCFKKPSLVLN